MSGRAELLRDGPVARIIYANPDDGVMDEAMEDDLLRIVEEVEADPEIRVCVHSGGDEGVFIRHYDLKPLAANADAMAARGMTFSTDRPVREAPIHKAVRMMEEGGTIHLAALNGTAMGGGFELALACDFRLAARGPYEFGLPEINLGILPGAGGTQRLRDLAGLARALEMTLTGRTLDADELVAAGIALSAHDPEELMEEALRLADALAAKPPLALRHIKRLVRRTGLGPDPLGSERALFCDLMVTEEAQRLLSEGASGARRITDAP